MNDSIRRLYVDADACPVKMEILQALQSSLFRAIFVASTDHRIEIPEAEVIQVEPGRDSVDFYITGHIRSGDIMVTQDIGLAAMVLPKRATVISCKGVIYREADMDEALYRRHLHQKAKRRGLYGKGPAAFTSSDRQKFLHVLTKVLENLQENDLD